VPGGVISHPKRLSDKAKANMVKSWELLHKGTKNAHRLAVFEEGVTWQTVGLPNKDSQWIEAKEFSVSELARWLRIPPHKIAHMRDATFSNIESQAREYLSDTLDPWLQRWQQEISRKLIPARSKMFAEHLTAALLRSDTKTRFDSYAVAVQNGWMSRNEVRVLENLNPAAGLDEFLIPLNSGPVGGSENTEPTG
ncbi:MAG: phage portal protein, partial [Planctomycetes bacterium]|nr:phage portal protein [Planctomycetota bacterium]